jgi:hypothetical protein
VIYDPFDVAQDKLTIYDFFASFVVRIVGFLLLRPCSGQVYDFRMTMDEPEIILRLWYVFDDEGNIRPQIDGQVRLDIQKDP